MNFPSESCTKESTTSKLITSKWRCNCVSNSWTINWLLLQKRLFFFFFFKYLAKQYCLLSYNLRRVHSKPPLLKEDIIIAFLLVNVSAPEGGSCECDSSLWCVRRHDPPPSSKQLALEVWGFALSTSAQGKLLGRKTTWSPDSICQQNSSLSATHQRWKEPRLPI